MKITIPKQNVNENFVTFLQQIKEKNITIENTIVLFQLLNSNSEPKKYLEDLLSLGDPISTSTYFVRIFGDSNVYWNGEHLNGL